MSSIDVRAIAQELLADLEKDKDLAEGRIEGVKLLYERIQQAVERSKPADPPKQGTTGISESRARRRNTPT